MTVQWDQVSFRQPISCVLSWTSALQVHVRNNNWRGWRSLNGILFKLRCQWAHVLVCFMTYDSLVGRKRCNKTRDRILASPDLKKSTPHGSITILKLTLGTFRGWRHAAWSTLSIQFLDSKDSRICSTPESRLTKHLSHRKILINTGNRIKET